MDILYVYLLKLFCVKKHKILRYSAKIPWICSKNYMMKIHRKFPKNPIILFFSLKMHNIFFKISVNIYISSENAVKMTWWKFTEYPTGFVVFSWKKTSKSCFFRECIFTEKVIFIMYFHWILLYSVNFHKKFREYSPKKMKIQWIYIFIFSKYSFPENSVKISWKFSEYWKFGAKFAEYSVYFPQKCIFMM